MFSIYTNFILKFICHYLNGFRIILAISLLLEACSINVTNNIIRQITPYYVTIVQGNFISRELASKLKIGQSRNDVQLIIGSPSIIDIFHTNRWDYTFFYFKNGWNSNAIVEKRNLILYFDNDKLVSLSDINNLPSESELITLISNN